MTRAIVVVVLAAACSRHPDGAPAPASEPTWTRVEIAECGFSVEMPEPVARSVHQPAPDLPARYMYTARSRDTPLIVECTPFPAGTLPTDHAYVINAWSERRRRDLEGMAGAGDITSSKVEPDGADAARFAIHFSKGKTVEGRMFIVGDQIREMSGLTDGSHETRRDLDRLLASYR